MNKRTPHVPQPMRHGCGRSARLPAWHEDREVCWSKVGVQVVVVVGVVVGGVVDAHSGSQPPGSRIL